MSELETCTNAAGPAFESRQWKKPRESGHPWHMAGIFGGAAMPSAAEGAADGRGASIPRPWPLSPSSSRPH